MGEPSAVRIAALFAALVCLTGLAPAVAQANPPAEASAHTQAPSSPTLDELLHHLPLPRPRVNRLHDPVSEAGQRARGIYITGPYVRAVGRERIPEILQSARLDAAVIDLKDGAGRVTYETNIEILQPQVHNFLGDARALVRHLKENGVYTIARIVCFADPQLPARHLDRAVLDVRPNRRGPWRSWGTAGSWLDPYNRVNHDMIVELTREAEALGFDEVQLDYIRFPVDDGIPYARFPADDGRPRWAVLKELLRRIDDAIHIPLGVDVFGLTAFDFGDTTVLGQNLEEWRENVEVFTPMLYLNSMRTWGLGMPNRDRRLVEAGVTQLRRRLGDEPVIRPFLQSFEDGADEPGPRFIANQLEGARRGRADGFLFWHPGSRYSMLYQAMSGVARDVGQPFPMRNRMEVREQAAARRAESDGRLARRAPSSR